MSENETKTTNNSEAEVKEVVDEVEQTVEQVVITPKKNNIKNYAVSIVVVAIIILGALYMMEKEGRSTTNIFESVLSAQEAKVVVAVVNGDEIINSELDTSIQQFGQAAQAQGVDITNPDAITEIRTQALDVLVNTRLLKQAAAEQGISVTDEEVTERLSVIESEIGGVEVLAARMEDLGISTEQLQKDVKDELIIQQLLDTVFAESDISVGEEELMTVYEEAGGADAGLPDFEEVKPQIEAQVKASKEQVVIDEYLNSLKSDSEIDIK